ncbi:hypothetical protein GX563_09495 [Candidatus Bathyarchaeota archaeon]|nr:hypothetical protein [Candidatus Bathyarchaeota archaeon]
MKTIICYASKSGNTAKIAEAMATELNCTAVKVTNDTKPASLDLDSYDLIFLGSGLYAGTPNEDLVKFLNSLNLKSSKTFALFITWGGAPRSDKMALGKLRMLLEGKGHKVLEEHYAAYGGWKGILMKRGTLNMKKFKQLLHGQKRSPKRKIKGSAYFVADSLSLKAKFGTIFTLWRLFLRLGIFPTSYVRFRSPEGK